MVGTCLWDGGLGRSHIAGGSACPKGGQLGSGPVSLIEEFRQVTFLARDRFGGRFASVLFDANVVSLHDKDSTYPLAPPGRAAIERLTQLR